jgi:TRAP-type C4-dicarboxylate transport system permease small subunit
MPIFYLMPVAILSLVAFSICIVFSRLRPYAFAALISPIVFAVCSIIGILLFGILVVSPLRTVLPVIIAQVAMSLVYLASGVGGAWAFLRVIRFIMHRIREVSALQPNNPQQDRLQ